MHTVKYVPTEIDMFKVGLLSKLWHVKGLQRLCMHILYLLTSNTLRPLAILTIFHVQRDIGHIDTLKDW